MKISACMTTGVRIVAPTETLQEAARAMAELDAGFLAVGKKDRLIGIITDRDIAIRGVANGRKPGTTVREVLSSDVQYCYADDNCIDTLYNMANLQVRPARRRSGQAAGGGRIDHGPRCRRRKLARR